MSIPLTKSVASLSLAANTEIDAIKNIYAIKVLRIYKIKTFLILK